MARLDRRIADVPDVLDMIAHHAHTELTDWEQEFIDSLQEQIDEGHVPSTKQLDVLDRIFETRVAR